MRTSYGTIKHASDGSPGPAVVQPDTTTSATEAARSRPAGSSSHPTHYREVTHSCLREDGKVVGCAERHQRAWAA